MKKDITSRSDIQLLVDEFYSGVVRDKLLGYIFTDIAKVNWEKHLPVMYNFFDNMLFYTGSYTGNPMELHKHLHKLVPLTRLHFQQWNKLFNDTVNRLFEGKNAELVKQRVSQISAVMQLKILDEPSAADKIF